MGSAGEGAEGRAASAQIKSAGLGVLALLAPFRGRIALGLVAAAMVAAAGAAYAYLSGPLLALLLGGQRASSWDPMLPEALSGAPSSQLLWALAGVLVGLALLKGLAQLAQTGLLAGVAVGIGRDLRRRVFAHLLRLPLAAHRRLTSGELLARLLDDVVRCEQAAVEAPLALGRELLAASALLGVVIFLAPKLALLALLTLPPVALTIGAVGRRVRRSAARGQQALGIFAQRAEQGLRAVRELKSFGAEGEQAEHVGQAADSAARWVLRQRLVRAVGPLFNEVAAAAALGAALIYASTLVSDRALAPSALVSFFTALLLLYRPIKGVGNAVSQIAAGRASAQRVAQLLLVAPEGQGGEDPEAELREALTLEGIGFRHGGTWILRDLDLSLRPGELVALRGASGAGKSTLLDVLSGLEKAHEGEARWDGELLPREEPRALRGRVALVPQQPLLLPGSVRDNLLFADPDADDDALWHALTAAGLAERCRRLALALEHPIGPGSGAGLSVGEVQRLALARALLRRRSVIALDEPSAALDAAHETRLLATLARLKVGRAILCVSHRPAILEVADRVLELRDGKLQEPLRQ